MQKFEGKSFEEQMRDSLEGAEMNPPEGIWTAIDGEIANTEAKSLRKQVVFYRAIAATLLLLIISAVFVGWQYNGLENSQYLVNKTIQNPPGQAVDHPELNIPTLPSHQLVEKSSEIENSTTNSIATANKNHIQAEKKQQLLSPSSVNAYISNNSDIDKNKNVTFAPITPEIIGKSTAKNYKTADNTKHNVPSDLTNLNQASKVLLSDVSFNRKQMERKDEFFPFDPETASEDVYYQKIPTYDFKEKNLLAENTSRNAKSWADFNVRGGVFEPNYQIQSAESVATPATGFRFASLGESNFTPSDTRAFTNDTDFKGEDLTAGYSYTMSMSYGKKITNKLFIVSGLEYGIYESVASTNRILSDGAEKRIAVTEQIIADGNIDFNKDNLGLGFENVELNNSFQFASIPLKLGYNLLDKKLSISITSGISTGIYLGNTIKDPDRVLEEVRVSRGDNSIYRDVNFSAVGGVSIGYKLFDNYLFTLEPVYQRALNSFTRNNSDFSALPENFGISAGVRVFIK